MNLLKALQRVIYLILPAFPKAGFKRTAVHWAETLTNMVEGPSWHGMVCLITFTSLVGPSFRKMIQTEMNIRELKQ